MSSISATAVEGFSDDENAYLPMIQLRATRGDAAGKAKLNHLQELRLEGSLRPMLRNVATRAYNADQLSGNRSSEDLTQALEEAVRRSEAPTNLSRAPLMCRCHAADALAN